MIIKANDKHIYEGEQNSEYICGLTTYCHSLIITYGTTARKENLKTSTNGRFYQRLLLCFLAVFGTEHSPGIFLSAMYNISIHARD